MPSFAGGETGIPDSACAMYRQGCQLQCESKKNPPLRFSENFSKRLGILNLFLHTYYTILSTLDYKFLFKYLRLWQSYAILSATT